MFVYFMLCILFDQPLPSSSFLFTDGNSPHGKLKLRSVLQVKSKQSKFCILNHFEPLLFLMRINCFLNILTEQLFISGFT